MQEIQSCDTVTVTNGDKKGEIGKVINVGIATRSHYVKRSYYVEFPDGSSEAFEEIIARDDMGKEMAKSLDLEKATEAKPAKEKAPAKPEPPEIMILQEDQTKVSKPKPKEN